MTSATVSIGLSRSDAFTGDALFRRILTNTLLICMSFGLAIPFMPLPERILPEFTEAPPRVVRFLLDEKKTRPVTSTVRKKKVEPKKTPKEKKAKKKAEPTRTAAKNSGLMAMKDELSALREAVDISTLSRRQSIRSRENRAARNDRHLLTENVSTTSRGVQVASLSRDTGGTLLEGKAPARVDVPVDETGYGDHAGRKGTIQERTRSIEEIQIVFDRNKSRLYAIYQRALRKNPGLHGKVVLEMTILPSGAVSHVRIVSSGLGDTRLERRLLRQIRQFHFGARDVEEMNITYPIDFLPA